MLDQYRSTLLFYTCCFHELGILMVKYLLCLCMEHQGFWLWWAISLLAYLGKDFYFVYIQPWIFYLVIIMHQTEISILMWPRFLMTRHFISSEGLWSPIYFRHVWWMHQYQCIYWIMIQIVFPRGGERLYPLMKFWVIMSRTFFIA